MDQLLTVGWWFGFAGQLIPWWIACAVLGVVAWPLTMRMFRGLTERGSALSIGIGIILVTWFSWLLSLEWFTGDRRAAFFRLLLLAMATGWGLVGGLFLRRGYVRGVSEKTIFVPSVIFGILGLVHLPFGIFSALGGVLLLALASLAAWIHEPWELRRQLKRNLHPFLTAQLLFLIAFFFFANVRSHLPWATYEIGLYAAEKWGNYTHIQSIVNSSAMPPKDIWFNGEPLNYYYGGHLVTATLARLTVTPIPVAFNLGLATIFALTVVMGFGFVYTLVHGIARRLPLGGGYTWHSGMAWGLLGAAAIALFGNLDPYRQFFTRDTDYGVRLRWEAKQKSLREDWKIGAGLAPDISTSLHGSVNTKDPDGGLESLRAELRRLEANGILMGPDFTGMATECSRILADVGVRGREREDALMRVVLPDGNLRLYGALPTANAIELREELIRLILEGRHDRLVPRLQELAKLPRSANDSGLNRLKAKVEELVNSAFGEQSLTELTAELKRIAEAPDAAAEFEALTSVKPADALFDLDEAIRRRNILDVATLSTSWLERAEQVDTPTDYQRTALGVIRGVKNAFRFRTGELLRDTIGVPPPPIPTTPESGELRYSWENVSFLDFWAPSRAIKSSPPGVREAGTITEFPYFSAILGDHHPHHSALPFTLAALCACLSLMRKNARLRRTDFQFIRRSWPDLLVMAFFIGAVFPVNIWDAVVLAPLYALVILCAFRKVEAGEHWRLVGFAGFQVLIGFVVALLWNSQPGVEPLFESTKAWLGAIAIMTIGIPLVDYLLGHWPRWRALLIVWIAAIIFIFVGALASDGNVAGSSRLSVAHRDVFVFALISAITASWTRRDLTLAVHRWWYGAGAVYAITGGLALVTILPFKLFFASPLQPAGKIFESLLPPMLSRELTGATDAFWATFWAASPVNGFPENLRTEMRDFLLHWGIFLIPIIAFAVMRLVRAWRQSTPGMGFMIVSLALAVGSLGRLYLGFWPGALSLAMIVLCVWYGMTQRGRDEGPIWIFLGGAFFWLWFVEALHFDDDYSGNYERYNTPFKIYYPLWPIMAGGMVMAVREIFARRTFTESAAPAMSFRPVFWLTLGIGGVMLPLIFAEVFPPAVAKGWFLLFWIPAGIMTVAILVSHLQTERLPLAEFFADLLSRLGARWGAVLASAILLALGLYYPLGATVTRTREFFTWPLADMGEVNLPNRGIYTKRTLDSLAHLGEYPEFKQDWKAIRWMSKNLPARAKLAARPSDEAYSAIGRVSTGSGRGMILNWKHHESQWRGRARPAPREMKRIYMDRITSLSDLSTGFRMAIPTIEQDVPAEVQQALRLSGDKERLDILRAVYPKLSLNELYRLRRVVEQNDVTMQQVMDVMMDDAHAIFRSEDIAQVKRIIKEYGITHVVVGNLERADAGYGSQIADRFRRWQFEEVYNSGAQQHLLEDELRVDEPTLVFRIPEQFLAGKEAPTP